MQFHNMARLFGLFTELIVFSKITNITARFLFCFHFMGHSVLIKGGNSIWNGVGFHLLWFFFFLKVFAPAVADRFSLEFEWQQVSSSLQDSPQYSGLS